MKDAMQIGLTGMRAQETVLTARAQTIANVNTKGYLPVEPVLAASEGGVRAYVREAALAPETLAGLQAQSGYPPVNLGDELVQLRLAEHAYKASAIVARTAARMGDETLKLFD